MVNMWDVRYTDNDYIFGKGPNVFFKTVIDKLPPGKLLVPGAGEGRDAAYAASLGWEVYCIDLSEVGKAKALKLAEEKGAALAMYQVGNIDDATYPEGYFDAIASIYFHLPVDSRVCFHHGVVKWIKPEGMFFVEAYTPMQLRNTSGGPKDLNMLITSVNLAAELNELEILENTETETVLSEGIGHIGKADIVRFVGKKHRTV